MEAVRGFLLPFLVSASATASFAVTEQNGACVREWNVEILETCVVTYQRLKQFVSLISRRVSNLCGKTARQVEAWLHHGFFLRLKIAADKTTKKSLTMLKCRMWWQHFTNIWGLALWTQSSKRRTIAETWHETWVEVREAVQSVHHIVYNQTDSPMLFVPLRFNRSYFRCVSATRSRAPTLVNMKPRLKSIDSKPIPSWPLSLLLVAVLFISPLEMLELVLQASDLGLLLVHHWDETWVQLPFQLLLILNLLLQPERWKCNKEMN